MSSSRLGTSGGVYTLNLDKIVAGTPSITSAVCKFSYVWDWVRNMGSATLQTIDDVEVNLYMFPLGISGMLGFMNTDPTKVTLPDGSTVLIYRVILDLIGSDTQKAALMIGENGEGILGTQNWEEKAEATVAMAEKVVNASYH